MPHRAPGSPARGPRQYLSGRPITYYRPTGDPAVRNLIQHGFQAFNAGRLAEACEIFAEKMLAPKNDTTIGLTIAGAMTPGGVAGRYVETRPTYGPAPLVATCLRSRPDLPFSTTIEAL